MHPTACAGRGALLNDMPTLLLGSTCGVDLLLCALRVVSSGRVFWARAIATPLPFHSVHVAFRFAHCHHVSGASAELNSIADRNTFRADRNQHGRHVEGSSAMPQCHVLGLWFAVCFASGSLGHFPQTLARSLDWSDGDIWERVDFAEVSTTTAARSRLPEIRVRVAGSDPLLCVGAHDVLSSAKEALQQQLLTDRFVLCRGCTCAVCVQEWEMGARPNADAAPADAKQAV